MSIKIFLNGNKWNLLYSAIAFLFGSLFISAVHKIKIVDMSLPILLGFFVMFIFSYGLYEFVGGDK